MEIINIRKGNFSWEIDFERAKYIDSGTMNFKGDVSFNVKEFGDGNNTKQVIFGTCSITVDVLDAGKESTKIGRFLVTYHVEMSPFDEQSLKINDESQETEIKKIIMDLIEPYFRYDFEKVMYDAELPKHIIPYGLFSKLDW